MPSSVKDLLAAANGSVPAISPQDAKALIESGQVLVVDVRDGLELQASGKVQGAKHVARGMLEFRPIRTARIMTMRSTARKP